MNSATRGLLIVLGIFLVGVAVGYLAANVEITFR